MLAIAIGGVAPMKNHDNWPQLARTNGWAFGMDESSVTINPDGTAWAGSASATGEVLAHPIGNGLQQPRRWFFLVLDEIGSEKAHRLQPAGKLSTSPSDKD
jgi:hypothetical protein